MKKRLLILLVIAALIVSFTLPISAVDYSEARENEYLREEYLESLLEIYPPPEGVGARSIKYTSRDHENATMSVNYLPYMVGDVEINLQLRMLVYPQAFEEYVVEDDFISTLFHEYNHLRAIRRDTILTEEKEYMAISEPNFQLVQSQPFKLSSFENGLNNKPQLNFNINFDLSWNDLYEFGNYDSEYIDKNNPTVSLLMIRRFIRTHVLEMLAVEEEIHLHLTKLNPSAEFQDSRYQVYSHHYLSLMRNLNNLEASEELKDSLEAIFYRDWLSDHLLSL